MNNAHPVQLLAIVGGSGAGKGWFVERLCRLFGCNACHLSLDDFYRDLSHLPMEDRARRNFDEPDAIDWAWAERVLRDSRRGRATTLPSYNFATHCRTAARGWMPRPIVLVDGLWLLLSPAIRELFALKIFLDTPSELRWSRRLARDVEERGYQRDAIEHQLRTTVAPMHDRYVEPQKQWADVTLTQPFREDQLLVLADQLWRIVNQNALIPPWEHETFRAELIAHLVNHEYCN